MRLCLRELPERFDSPEAWLALLKRLGYTAAYAPVDEKAPDALIQEYAAVARENDIVISEVNAWSNPISSDPSVREAAIAFCIRRLELAEKLGARCCVNIAGSKAAQWDGPHPDNFLPAVQEEIVRSVQRIVSAVRPQRTRYSLEPMPFMPPDSPENYLELVRAVDMRGFGVHCDPVNIISSPRLHYANGAMIRRFFSLLGPYIDSCHIKDTTLGNTLTVHLGEACPGDGGLDIAAYLRCINALHPDTTLLVEHQPDAAAYARGAAHIRAVARREGIPLA